MIRRRQVLVAGGAAATLAATGLPRPAIAAASKTTLRFVPQAALANPDPIWTTATVAINHGYMVYDTLYGIDNALRREAADVRRARAVVRRADLDVHAARRAALARQHAGPRRSTAPPRSIAGRRKTRSASSSPR